MAQLIVEARNLVEKYGDFMAVNEVSFTIEEGQVFGLLGPNGAGKSTTISMLTCLFPPSNGSARVDGHDIVQNADQVKQLIGVVPQDLALYPSLSARDNLAFFGEMFGLGGKELKQRVSEVLDYVAMSERADASVDTLSGGMKGLPGRHLPRSGNTHRLYGSGHPVGHGRHLFWDRSQPAAV